MAQNAIVERLLAQQAALAGFGRFALNAPRLNDILDRAALICAKCLKYAILQGLPLQARA